MKLFEKLLFCSWTSNLWSSVFKVICFCCFCQRIKSDNLSLWKRVSKSEDDLFKHQKNKIICPCGIGFRRAKRTCLNIKILIMIQFIKWLGLLGYTNTILVVIVKNIVNTIYKSCMLFTMSVPYFRYGS